MAERRFWLGAERISYDLWEIEGVIADGVEDEILELVDRGQQLVTEGCHSFERRAERRGVNQDADAFDAVVMRVAAFELKKPR